MLPPQQEDGLGSLADWRTALKPLHSAHRHYTVLWWNMLGGLSKHKKYLSLMFPVFPPRSLANVFTTGVFPWEPIMLPKVSLTLSTFLPATIILCEDHKSHPLSKIVLLCLRKIQGSCPSWRDNSVGYLSRAQEADVWFKCKETLEDFPYACELMWLCVQQFMFSKIKHFLVSVWEAMRQWCCFKALLRGWAHELWKTPALN